MLATTPNQMKTYYLYILISLSLFSCKQKEKINQQINIYYYCYTLPSVVENKFELRDSVMLYIDTINIKEETLIAYKMSPLDSFSYGRFYSIKKDSFNFGGVFCKLVDTIEIDNKYGKIELYKSIYNVENGSDEEFYIYWNHKFGMISNYSKTWDIINVFDNEQIPNFTKDCFLEYIIELKEKERLEINRTIDKY
jgi:hypothetical protein